MAERSVILWLGDELLKSTRPASELVEHGYDGVQIDSRIWNAQSQAWENLLPGTNTDTWVGGSSDKYGPEVRTRPTLLATIPTGFVDHIKYCVTNSTLTFADFRRNPDGTAAAGALRPCWYPLARDTTAYSGCLAQVKAAAAAANGVGDTLSIKHVVIGLFLAEALLGVGWRSYGARMLDLINALQTDLFLTPYVTIGSFRPGAVSALEVSIIAPHADFSTGYSEAQKGIIASMRSQLETIKSDAFRVSVVPTNELACTDGLHFDTSSLISLGNKIPATFYAPAAIDDSSFSVAEVFAILGDSIFDGSGAAPHPDYLTGAQPSVNIWARDPQSWEAVQIGANNLISAVPSAGLMGIEVPLGVMLRNHFGTDVWLSKCTQIGSHAGPYPDRSPTAAGPTTDPYAYDWHPATSGGMFDMSTCWLKRGAESLRSQSRAPRLNTVALCLGTNDLILPSGDADHLEVVPSIKQLVRSYINTARALGMVRASQAVKVVIGMPTSRLGSASLAPWAAGKTEVVRGQLQEWADADESVRIVDIDPFGTNDGIHLNTQGTLDCALAMFNAWKGPSTATVQPLFVPTKLDMLKALRLSQVPDTNDAKYQIDQAIANARVLFYSALGNEAMDALLAKQFAIRPTTSDEIARALALAVEIKMVRRELLRVMPTMFMDGANAVQSWNQEAAFREGSYLQTRAELQRLEDEIREGLTILSNGTVGESQIATLYPDEFFNPGDTLYSGEVL